MKIHTLIDRQTFIYISFIHTYAYKHKKKNITVYLVKKCLRDPDTK